MLVVNWMSTRLVKTEADVSMAEAGQLMEDYHIGHLPVVAGDKLVGILSDRDLKRAFRAGTKAAQCGEPGPDPAKLKVRDYMSEEPCKVSLYDTIEEAALIMLEARISGLPVVDEVGKLVAMITKNDICRALVSLSGVTSGGIQFGMDISDDPGSIKACTDVIRSFGGRMVSIFTSYDRVAAGRRKAFIRVKGLDRARLGEVRDQLTKVGVLIYILDSTQQKKELLALGRYGSQ